MTVMSPKTLPSKTPDERVSVYFQMSDFAGTDMIVGIPVFASDPVGLEFSYQSAIDDGKTAAALVGGGLAGTTYTVSADCTMSSGQIFEPSVALPVESPKTETLPSGTSYAPLSFMPIAR